MDIFPLFAPRWIDVLFEPPHAGWHSERSNTPPSFLADEFLVVENPGPEELKRRREARTDWVLRHGFLGPFEKVPSALRKLDADALPTEGHYLVALDKDECYIGQTRTFKSRLADHRRTYGDEVSGYYVRPDRVSATIPDKQNKTVHLVKEEKKLIHDAQKSKLVARNFKEMAHPITPHTDFADSIIPMSPEDWFANPVAANAADPASLKRPLNGQYAGARARFEKLNRTAGGPMTIELVGDYLRRCMPYPARTEGTTWSVSCMPTAVRGKPGMRSKVLACLSISWTEVLTIGTLIDGSGQWAKVAVNDLELGGLDWNTETRLRRRHPGIGIESATYSEMGPGVSFLLADDWQTMKRLLDDVEVTRAAATVALRLCRLGKSMQRDAHNPFLVDAALGDSYR